MITRVGYTGAALPEDSDTETLFDSTTLPGPFTQAAGIKRYSLNLVNSHGGTIKLYKTDDRGTNWIQTKQFVYDPSSFSHQIDLIVEDYTDFKVDWVNGGTTQTTFEPSQALVDDKDTGFSPLSLSQGANKGSLKVWLHAKDSAGYTLESGSANDLRRVDSYINRATTALGGLGGAFDQGTSANKPVLATFPEGRVLFNAGGSDRSEYSGTVTDLDFLATGSWTIAFDLLASVNATTILFDQTNGSAANKGLRIRRLSNNLEVGIADGTLLNTVSFTNAFLNWTTEVKKVVLTYDGVNVTCYVNGAQIGSPTALSPAVGSVSLALAMGASSATGGNALTGYIPELVIYNRVLNASEITALESYLNRWTLNVTWDDLVTYANLWNILKLGNSTGSAWADRLAAYAVTEVATPTHGTDAAYNNENVITLNGTSQYAHYDALAADLANGDDVAHSVMLIGDINSLAANRTPSSIGGSVSGDIVSIRTNTTPIHQHLRVDADVGTANINGPTATTNPARFGYAFRGQTASYYLDGVRSVEQGALNSAALSLDRATLGASRGTSVGDYTPGRFAAALYMARCLNMGDWLILDRAGATKFGL